VLQALLPTIIPALGLTLGMAGALVSVYQFTSSVVQPLVGHLADRSAVRWPAWAGVGASGIAAGLLGLAPSYPVLLALLLLGGTGTAIFHPVSGALVGAAAPPERRGRWMGLYVTSGNFGTALGPFALAALLVQFGPGGSWLLVLPALLAAALVARVVPARERPSKALPPLRQTLRRHGRVLGALTLVVTLRSWSNAGLSTFIPLLGRARGLDATEAIFPLTVYLLAAAFGGLAGGFAADRWGRDRVIVTSFLLAVPFGLYVALGGDAGPGFILAGAGAGFFLNSSFVVLTIRGQESVPGSVGMVSGILLGLSVGLGGLAVTPLALFAEGFGLPAATALAAALGLVGAASMRLVPATPNVPTS